MGFLLSCQSIVFASAQSVELESTLSGIKTSLSYVLKARSECHQKKETKKWDSADQQVLDMDLPEELKDDLVSLIKTRAPSEDKWTFIMLSPHQNLAVVRWLSEHSKRPQKAVLLYNLSYIITELVKINAIIRRRDGRRMRYFMNPNGWYENNRRNRQRESQGRCRATNPLRKFSKLIKKHCYRHLVDLMSPEPRF